MTTTEERWHSAASVVKRAVADRDGARQELDDAVRALEAAIRRRAPLDECLSLFEPVERGVRLLQDESADAVARTVGAYLMEHGHAESWRALYPILLAELDIWCGLHIQGYAIGDEVAFVGDAGWWEKEKDRGNH